MDWNAELEALVRQNPEDPEAWAVLEDWTLEQDDLRSRVIECEKAETDEITDATQPAQDARWALRRALFGRDHGSFSMLFNCSLRAGYIVGGWLTRAAKDPVATLDQVLAMPSAALMSSFSAEVETPEAIEPLLRRLVHLPLRQLTIGALWDPMLEVKFEPRWLTDHAIERLKLMQRPITLPLGPEVSRLTQLWIAPGRPDDLHRLFEPPGAFPRLSELNVDCQFLERRHGNETSHFAEVLNGAATPVLRALHCRYARVELQASLLERVATSKILPRLEAFSFNPWSNDSVQLATVPERHRAAFAHLR